MVVESLTMPMPSYSKSRTQKEGGREEEHPLNFDGDGPMGYFNHNKYINNNINRPLLKT